jgi:hypothetical protein
MVIHTHTTSEIAMKKSKSSPTLSSLGTLGSLGSIGTHGVQAPTPRAVQNNIIMRKSVSTAALSDMAPVTLMVPSTPLEQIGFHSLLKASPATMYDCAVNFNTLDFPKQLLGPRDQGTKGHTSDELGLAACLATPSDPPAEPRAPVFRPPMVAKWIEFCAGDEKLVERFNNLRRRLRTFRNNNRKN